VSATRAGGPVPSLKESQAQLESQQAKLEQTNSQLEEQAQLLEHQRRAQLVAHVGQELALVPRLRAEVRSPRSHLACVKSSR